VCWIVGGSHTFIANVIGMLNQRQNSRALRGRQCAGRCNAQSREQVKFIKEHPVYSAQGRIFSNMLYVRYAHLATAKPIHKTNPSSHQRGCYIRTMTTRVQLQK
jgi:hypothetical protein